jgi:DNA-binding NarL/FixJ family response regulator
MNRPRLLLAEDHPETRELLRGLLLPEFDVLGEVEDGVALVAAAERLSPDVIVTDISMPRLDGMAAAEQILRRDPMARIVLVTAHREPVLAERGVSAGVMGYVLKLVAGDELVPAVKAAMRGERHLSDTTSVPPVRKISPAAPAKLRRA